jgi:hypothetical protein
MYSSTRGICAVVGQERKRVEWLFILLMIAHRSGLYISINRHEYTARMVGSYITKIGYCDGGLVPIETLSHVTSSRNGTTVTV